MNRTPEQTSRCGTRQRSAASSPSPGRSHPSTRSLEDPNPAARKRGRHEGLSETSTATWQRGHEFNGGAASGQSQVHNGDVHGDVHYHHGRGSESYSAEPKLTKEQERIERILGSLEFPQMGTRKDTIATAYGVTCRWLFTRPEYKRWRDPDHMKDHHGFMWIKGKPGAGKSTLVKFVCESAREQFPDEQVISFFFHARGTAEERSLTGMFRQLLHQLFVKIPRLQSHLAAHSKAKASEQSWQLSSMKALYRAVVLDLKSDRLTCFIDALDECSEDEIRELVNFFEDLGVETATRDLEFRVCLSSRHYPYIDMDECQQLDLDEQADHQRDISLYVDNKLKLRKGKIADEILASVKQRAQGVFLWVVLVVHILKRDYHRGDIHKVRDRLLQIPDGLHNLFHDIIHRGAGDSDNLLSTLQWIAFARWPLTPRTLYFAILSGQSDLQPSQLMHGDDVSADAIDLFILNCSKGLAETTKGSYPLVQFIHESVREYLAQAGLQTLASELQENLLGASHNHLKHCCNRWLAMRGADVELPTSNDSDVPLETKYSTFSLYAACNVFFHAELAYRNGIPQTEFLEVFPLSRWHALVKRIDSWSLDDVLNPRGPRHFAYADVQANGMSLTRALVDGNAPALLASELRRNSHLVLSESFETTLRLVLDFGDSTMVDFKLGGSTIVEMILEKGGTAVRPIEDQVATLKTAITKRYTLALQLMFGCGLYDIPLRSNSNLLVAAVHTADEDIVKMLLDRESHPYSSDDKWDRKDAFDAAASSRNLYPMLDLLIGYGLSGDGESLKPCIDNALLAASARDNVLLVRVLIFHGANVNFTRDRNATPLSLAFANRCYRVVKPLSQAGAKLSHPRVQRQLPIACRRGNEAYVAELLNMGMEVDCLSPNGHPLFYSVSVAGNANILKMLFARQADLGVRHGQHYHGALLEASRNGKEDVVRVLLVNGDGVPRQPQCYYSIVMEETANRGHAGIARSLLDNGDGFRAQLAQGPDTYVESLRLAISRGHSEIVQILRDRDVKLPEETMAKIDTDPQDAWINALPDTFFRRPAIANISRHDPSLSDPLS